MEKNKKGIIFYKTKDNIYYYINFNREHIIFDKKMINDPICKDIIIKTAKQYTIKGYNMLCNKLFAEHKAIHIYHYITENFINKNYIML